MTSTNSETIKQLENVLNKFSSDIMSLSLEYDNHYSIESFLKMLLEEYEGYLIKTKDKKVY